MAPYGQENIPELKSVFEWPRLKDNAIFLDIQCTSLLPSHIKFRADPPPMVDRMPTAIGSFISHHVYDSKLETEHNINSFTCCRFIDVSNGKESKKGHSWTVCVDEPRLGFTVFR